MSEKKHAHAHEHEKKKTAEMKKPDSPTEDALFSEEPVSKKKPEQPEEAEEMVLSQLEAELRQTTDKMLRAHAELENYRRRASREMDDIQKYASAGLIRDLLPVWDNMGRALEAVEKTHDADSLIEGVKMMYEQFVTVLKQYHCERIEAVGEPFDPHIHESISKMPSNDYPPGTVIFESQAGFKLHDRVVRPSQVVLAAEP
ncbi:MAG: nucleotide exchange factor GrpE [Planctomycetaceae bacterium]|nr:nucleotide exchange factor GrpE [Planctomycetaceae bacterium]